MSGRVPSHPDAHSARRGDELYQQVVALAGVVLGIVEGARAISGAMPEGPDPVIVARQLLVLAEKAPDRMPLVNAARVLLEGAGLAPPS